MTNTEFLNARIVALQDRVAELDDKLMRAEVSRLEEILILKKQIR